MPCVITKEEMEYYERKENEEAFGVKMTDSQVLEEVLCGACRTLVKEGVIKKAPKLVQQWWKLHARKDRAEGRPLPRRKR